MTMASDTGCGEDDEKDACDCSGIMGNDNAGDDDFDGDNDGDDGSDDCCDVHGNADIDVAGDDDGAADVLIAVNGRDNHDYADVDADDDNDARRRGHREP